jgi:2-hydroxy-4-carboxymuconate semialdehyde hemiacetal dehydrogenase
VLGLCLVGPGGVARLHMKALVQIDGWAPVAVVDKDEAAARAFADEWGFDLATVDLDAALANANVDVVLITSPNALHSGHALRALDAEKHVIVEIPAAMTYAEACEVDKRARRVDRRVLVCHTMRSFPAIREVRERVASRRLTLSHVVGFVAVPRRENEHWAGGRRDWIDDLLWHNACHYLDASLWVLGRPEVAQVSAQFGRRNRRFGMAMDVGVGLTTTNQELVSLAATYNTGRSHSEIRFVGDQALLTLANGHLLDDEGEELTPPASWDDLLPQDRELLAALLTGAPSDYSIASVLPTMKVLDAAQRYARSTSIRSEA